MVDYPAISFSMKTSSPAGTEADVIAFDQCSAFGLPDAAVMLKSHRSGMRVLVPDDIFGILQHCTAYRSTTNHFEHLVRVDPAIEQHKDQINQVFKDLKNQGLIDSGQRVISALQQSSGFTRQPAPFAGVFIRTCDRPEQLKRLLDSLSNNQQRFGHHHRYVVVDDSRSVDALRQNQKICSEYANNEQLLVEYYGQQQQSDFIKTLQQVFPEDNELIHWLLGRDPRFDEGVFTGGRLFNHIILLAAGQRFALFDDDAVCQPYQSPQMQNNWNFKANPKDTWFYQEREEMFAEVQSINLDPLSRHLDVLGKTLGDIVNELSAVQLGIDALDGVNTEDAPNLKPETAVLITRNGTFGDPGTSSMTWAYQQESHVLEHLSADPEKFKQYLANRTLWLGSHTFRAVNENSLMTTTLTGIDGSELMPPTGPYYRNEDYLFSRLIKFIHPSSLIFEFPWGLPHLPEPQRQWHPAKLDEPKTVGILGFMADIANNVQSFCLAQSPQLRLFYIGETYRSLADATLETLSSGIEENLLNARTAAINSLQLLLSNNSNQPKYWIEDVERMINANKNGLAQPGQCLFPDQGSGETPKAQIKSCQSMLSMYGDALILWPKLWEYCKQHHAEFKSDVCTFDLRR